MFHAALLKKFFLENYLIHYRENTKIKKSIKASVCLPVSDAFWIDF